MGRTFKFCGVCEKPTIDGANCCNNEVEMSKDDDLSNIDIDDYYDEEQDIYEDYLFVREELMRERRMCQRHFVPEDDYLEGN